MNITIRRRNNKYYIDDELEVTRFKAFDVINKALALIESLSSIYTIRFKYLDEYISIELVKENLKKYIDNTDQVCIVSDLECDFFMSFKNINYYSIGYKEKENDNKFIIVREYQELDNATKKAKLLLNEKKRDIVISKCNLDDEFYREDILYANRNTQYKLITKK